MILVNNRDKLEWREKMCIQDVLDAMNYTYPLITIHVNEILIPEEDYQTFFVPDEAQVSIFHLAHGG